jgi:hypothetical protein
MESQQYQRLNPVATAIAAGCTELLFALFVGFRMMGMMSQYGHMGWSGPGITFGTGLVWWLGGALLTALAGAAFAWIYNAINRITKSAATGQQGQSPRTPSA